MKVILWLATAALLGQVPEPGTPGRDAESLRVEKRTILDREAKVLTALAKAVKIAGDEIAATSILSAVPEPPSTDGAARFVPIPELIPSSGKGLANVPAEKSVPEWRAGMNALRLDSANVLFDLATRAARSTPKHLALADECLRQVIDRVPDHAEARRLLGQVKFEGGWATPFAVSESQKGKALHPVFGWVRKSWVAHLEKGELPENGGVAEGRERWIPAADADARHRDWAKAWTIHTEHFDIKTNVPLAESIAFGRHLETLHEVFEALFADVIGDNLPLALRFKTSAPVRESKSEPHLVFYFADRQEYIEHLRATQPRIEESLGLYLPPTSPKAKRGHAYFFRDQGGDLPVTATLFHEVSHQLLFESGIARNDAYKSNAGNYWVFEGLGTYFETLQIAPDGSVRIGGLSGRRNEEAKKRLVAAGALVPIQTFIQFDPDAFNAERMIFRHYQQASALTSLLMDGRDRKYREGFLRYVRDACRGSLRRGSGQSLEQRIDADDATIERELLEYLEQNST